MRQNRMRTLLPLEPLEDDISVFDGERELINFSSNDYLGLSKHPLLARRAEKYMEQYGAGATASRMISGTYRIHKELEEKIAAFFDAEAALLFNSGYQANSTVLQALTDRHSLILADKLSHNSLIQGSLASRAQFQRYEHNDLDHLERLLEKAASDSRYNRLLILTETVFSMDGDRSDVNSIAELAARYDAMLYVDDAHAVGVWGRGGRGLAYDQPGIDVVMGTFGKAFGVFGSYIVCSAEMKDYLINYCPGFIYTTALPPSVVGSIDAAFDLVPKMEEERTAYHKNIDYLLKEIRKCNLQTGSSSTQIIPLLIGNEEDTIFISNYFMRNGILAPAIRPPTVPEESSRIRLTLSSKHTPDHIGKLIKILRGWNA